MQRYRLPLIREVPIPSDEEAALPQPIAYYCLAADVDAREAQSVAVIKAQRERIAELEQQVYRLKASLDFWLPQVPIDGNEQIIKRIGNDAMLLFDVNHTLDECAEDLGWITLNATAQGKFSSEGNSNG